MGATYTIIYVNGKPPHYGYSCDNCGKYLRSNRHYRLAENGACFHSWYHSIERARDSIIDFFENSDSFYDEDGNETEYTLNIVKDAKSYFAEEETEE